MNATKYITTPTLILAGIIITLRGCLLHWDKEVDEARKHPATVEDMKCQAYVILNYVYDTKNSPKSLEEIQEYFDRESF